MITILAESKADQTSRFTRRRVLTARQDQTTFGEHCGKAPSQDGRHRTRAFMSAHEAWIRTGGASFQADSTSGAGGGIGPDEKKEEGTNLECLSAGSRQKEVRSDRGPTVRICDDESVCKNHRGGASRDSERGSSSVPKPKEIKGFPRPVRGRAGRPRRFLGSGPHPTAHRDHRGRRRRVATSNILLRGPTGCGKTLRRKTLAKTSACSSRSDRPRSPPPKGLRG